MYTLFIDILIMYLCFWRKKNNINSCTTADGSHRLLLGISLAPSISNNIGALIIGSLQVTQIFRFKCRFFLNKGHIKKKVTFHIFLMNTKKKSH